MSDENRINIVNEFPQYAFQLTAKLHALHLALVPLLLLQSLALLSLFPLLYIWCHCALPITLTACPLPEILTII